MMLLLSFSCSTTRCTVSAFTTPSIPQTAHPTTMTTARFMVAEEEEPEMTAQERILREAGLWEEEDAATKAAKQAAKQEAQDALDQQKNRNLTAAIVSVVLAASNFFWQYTHPVTSSQLLMSMQQSSAPMTAIGTNGKPTVVDFWAPWCENCKFSAPTLSKVEEEYKDRVNFVMVNGDLAQAWPYLETFKVDAIPHLALVSADGTVETALIGPTPKSVLEADLNVMLQNAKEKESQQQELPYVMLDVFANSPPERRHVHFEEE